jgi:hypothetical protein
MAALVQVAIRHAEGNLFDNKKNRQILDQGI